MSDEPNYWRLNPRVQLHKSVKKGTRNLKRCVSCQEHIYVACKKCPKCKAQQPHKDRLVKERKKFAAEEKEWKERVTKNCNGTHVLDSSFKMLDRLAALGYFPLLLLGKKRRNDYTADILTSMQMKLDDCLEEDLKAVYGKVLKLHFRRFLQPTPETSEDSRTEQDVQQLLVINADVPLECLDLDQEDPEPLHIKEEPEPLQIKEEPEPLHIKEEPEPLHIKEEPEPLHIKEEKEDLWNCLEGEQLNVLEEADITKFKCSTVTVRLHQSQTEDNSEAAPPAGRSAKPIKTETDGEDCGGSGPARNLKRHRHSHPNADDEKASVSSETEVSYDVWQEPLLDSGPESEDGDNVWKETKAPESAAHSRKYKKALVSHMGCNTGNKSFSFFKCSKRFYYKAFLQRHMMCHFGKMSSNCLVRKKLFRVKQKKESWARENPFSCDVCGKRFTVQKILKQHMTVHTGEKPFGCDDCGRRFARQGNLKQHMRVHTGEKQFSCDVCGKIFTGQGDLKKHIRVHTGEKPFSCNVCEKRFTQQGSLKKHIRVHTGEKPFSCNVCEKRFTQQGSLKIHMIVHTGEKPVGCDLCGKRFTGQGNLKTHMRVHTGEKQFSCDVCGKRFTQQGHLKRHTRVHSGEKQFSCDVCGKRFTQQGHLKRHTRVHTE